MDKAKSQHAIAVPISLYPEELEYVNRISFESNFSKRIRQIIREHREVKEGLARYDVSGKFISCLPGAILIYEQSEDEKKWVEELPFTFNKKDGWSKIRQAALKNGFRCQVYEKPDIGYVAVWVVTGDNKCIACKTKLLKIVEAL
jgi:hypothetical protein